MDLLKLQKGPKYSITSNDIASANLMRAHGDGVEFEGSKPGLSASSLERESEEGSAVIKTSLRVGFKSYWYRANRLTSSVTEAEQRKAAADWIKASESIARRPFRLIHPKKRPTIQRRGRTAKPA